MFKDRNKLPCNSFVNSRQIGPITISTENMPWLKTDEIQLNGVEINIDGHNPVIIASAIRHHNKLLKIAQTISPEKSQRINTAFYAQIADIVEGRGVAPRVQHATGISYAKDASGVRAFFTDTHPNEIPQLRAFILVAVIGDKSQEPCITSILTRGKGER